MGHIHDHHIEDKCEIDKVKAIEDTCLGWVKWWIPEQRLDTPCVAIVQELLSNLLSLREEVLEIHYLALGKTLHLRRSLVSAFERINTKLLVAAAKL